MKTTFQSILLGAFVLTSFNNIAASNIIGKFADASHNGKLVYLQTLDKGKDEHINIDSTVVKNGSFKFSALATDTPKVRFISLDRKYWPALIILEKGQIEITVDTLLKVSVKGTPLNIAYQDCQDKNDIINQKGRAIFLKLQDSKSKGVLTDDIYKESLKERLNLLDAYENNIIELIKANAQNSVGEYLLLEVGQAYIRPEKMSPLFDMLRPDFRKSERVQIMENRSRACERTAVGKPFSDVKGVDINGKATALSDYVGKGSFVLLDFWASWCGSCRERIPEIKSLYEKYKNKGLVIVGISFDNKMDQWKRATAEENILWPQLSDLKDRSEASVVYGVHSIPQLMLVDKNGIIIDRDLSCDYYALGFKLSEIFR